VVLSLLVLGAIFVRVDDGGVIVLVLVIARAMLELADRAALVVMRHVPVVVRVHFTFVRMLVFLIADS
jgi:hypothetical protein